jgi:replicative DNA helicase
MVMGQQDLLRFADVIGTVGVYKSSALTGCREIIASKTANTNRDVIPNAFWRAYVVPIMKSRRITLRRLQESLGMSFMGTGLYKQNVSRERLQRVTVALGGDHHLQALATSDVYWDKIVSVTPDGEEDVFDLTVPGPSNFVANDFIVHNSIEQDADTVLLLHRPDRYEPGQHEGVIEVIIGKQRNGPTGEVTLTYLKEFMRYEDFAPGGPFDG